MAGGNPESPSKVRSAFASFFGATGERAPLSPQNNQSTPRNSTLKVYDTEELGGFTPNSAVPMQASVSNASSNHPSSSDFSMSPHNYFETSLSSPNSSHGFSSGTTPGYDQDMPFDMSTPMPEEDMNIDDFIGHPPSRTGTQPTATQPSQSTLAPTTSSNNAFPSPAMTNASLTNSLNRTDGVDSQARSSPHFSHHAALPVLSSPNITVDDHDASQSNRRIKKRGGEDDANLNRVLPAGKPAAAATDDEIPSLKDQELMAIESENHMKVFRWLSGEGSGHLDASNKPNRIRSRSVGHVDASDAPTAPQNIKPEETNDYPPDGTPRGEGDVLFDDSEEESTDGHTSDEEGLPDSLIPENELGFPDGIVSHLDDDDIGPPRHVDSIQKMTEDDEKALAIAEPNPNTYYRPAPWHDAPKPFSTMDIRDGSTRGQPLSSNAAIERWKRANENIETASRVATFGTMRSRRYSIGEMDGLFKRMSFGQNDENLTVVRRPNPHQDRKPSLFEVKNVLKRFSSAGHEHKTAALHAIQNFSDKASSKETKPLRKDSQKSKLGRERSPSRLSSLTRKLSKKRKQSDTENTKDTVSAFAGMAGLGMTIGGAAASSSNPMSPQSQRQGSLKGRVEFGIPAFTPNIGGRHQSQGSLSVPSFEPLEHEASDEDADAPHEAVAAPPPQLKIPIDKITPNRSGFAKHCLQLNPQLHPKLIDRIAIEQVKRFRKLQENFMKHHAIVQNAGKCANGNQCGAIANQGRENNAHLGHVDSPNNNASYAMQDYDSDDEDGVPSTDGRVTATQFPPGVPMPPVNRLPAEFECTLCFKTKKFQKPSDWTKHVHEDVQPFTCTFPDCTEPKSFKRKADWVRHENEKHRHLEWWTCNLPDCNHKCYRKDNFVQHLVREHKMPEVKVKAAKSGASSAAKAGAAGRGTKKGKNGAEDDEANKLWDIVAACYKETTSKPTSEPCRFCGCRLQSWKKLTVHLARHMEAISLPVITLIGEDAVLSPASTRRGNSTTVTPITPFNPTAFSATGPGSIISPIVNDLQGMYVGAGPQSSFYSPTRPSGVYPSPHVTPPQRNGGNVVENRIAYTNAMDPSLTATLHQQTQFQGMQPLHNDLDLFMGQLQEQQHQQPHAQQNPIGYNMHGGNMAYGMGHDSMLGYSNPNMVGGHVPPGLGITNPTAYGGGWNQGGQHQAEDETDRFMNWPSSQAHHQPY
ncbi:hypothetical protein H072_9038 [Dactylellina haptotyla CBS 200.50]|uniref:C2H2-type domain-containing protein n=1 Tax=Dactylellina haptotyla (strain CBS 200.50) TaxID=1284197 RepID=S8A7Z9_DACHA|nr:hypothetical protein H072_9038 [Dactylellina haptotyla CBS 200.50]